MPKKKFGRVKRPSKTKKNKKRLARTKRRLARNKKNETKVDKKRIKEAILHHKKNVENSIESLDSKKREIMRLLNSKREKVRSWQILRIITINKSENYVIIANGAIVRLERLIEDDLKGLKERLKKLSDTDESADNFKKEFGKFIEKKQAIKLWLENHLPRAESLKQELASW
jgi:chromosome condensin MukBEF ATPase and DNA-binding subunit MukB